MDWQVILLIALVLGILAFLTYNGSVRLWGAILIGAFGVVGILLWESWVGLFFAIPGLLIYRFAGYIYNRFGRPVKAREFRAGDEILFVGRAAFRDLKGHRATVLRKHSRSSEGSTVLYYILRIDDGREVEAEESDVEGFAEKVGVTGERRTLDEAQRHVQRAKRHVSRDKKKSNVGQAIEEMKLAVTLNPVQANYHAELGLTYLRVPELAVVQGVDVPFKLSESAKLALAEFEEAATLSERYSAWPALAYWHLGEAEKVIRCASGLKEGWERYLRKENAELILQAIRNYPAQMLDMKQALKVDLNKKEMRDLVTKKIKSEPTKFKEYANDFLEIRRLMEIPDPEPEEARKHLEQAVAHRDLGEYDDAKMDLDIARHLAPSIAWWYETLCELGA